MINHRIKCGAAVAAALATSLTSFGTAQATTYTYAAHCVVIGNSNASMYALADADRGNKGTLTASVDRRPKNGGSYTPLLTKKDYTPQRTYWGQDRWFVSLPVSSLNFSQYTYRVRMDWHNQTDKKYYSSSKEC
jgi:hypothetical protein